MNESINKGIKIFAFATIAIILLSGIGAAAIGDKNIGDVIGTYIYSDAKSNGPCVAKYSGIYEGKDCGITANRPWQCVEYVKRFYRDSLKVENQWLGDGGTYYGSATAKGLWAYPNGGTVKPQPGDILAFSGSPYGHVAIIKEVGETDVKVIEQNWARNDAIHSIPYDKTANRIGSSTGYRGSYKVQGWLRKESIELISPNGGETWTRNVHQVIHWKYYGDPGSSVEIWLQTSLFPVKLGTASIGSNGEGSFAYLVNQPVGYSAYKISIYSSKWNAQNNAFYKDTSDGYFTIR